MLKKQTFSVRNLDPDNTIVLRNFGLDHPEGISVLEGKNWLRYQVCHQSNFSLVALESYRRGSDSISYTRQEDYIKINFWLSGKHTTILNGFGEHEHERPSVFITCGPLDMLKVDVLSANTQVAAVCLCVLPDFFPEHMGIAPEELPEPLRAIVFPHERPYALHSVRLTADLAVATRAVLAAPFAVRQQPLYIQAKAVELICLLIEGMRTQNRESALVGKVRSRQESRLHQARELIAKRYAEPVTLEQISREVGLNRMALTSGFRRLFGMSVYDCLQKERMDLAFRLLQDDRHTVAQIAEAVGYTHSCNFSTAFRAHFGCTPQAARYASGRRN